MKDCNFYTSDMLNGILLTLQFGQRKISRATKKEVKKFDESLFHPHFNKNNTQTSVVFLTMQHTFHGKI